MSAFQNLLPITGLALLAAGLFLVWRRPPEMGSITGIFIAGAAMLLLSDKGIKNFKLDAEGLEVTRDQLTQVTVDYTEQFAKLSNDIEKKALIITQQSKILAEHQTRLNGLHSGSIASSPEPDGVAHNVLKQIHDISENFTKNSKYSILVFYRSGPFQKLAAEKIASDLVRLGYQSSATNTDLTEVIPQLSGDRKPGKIVIAARSSKLPIITEVQDIAAKAAAANNLSSPTLVGEEWSFRRGDVQIYVF